MRKIKINKNDPRKNIGNSSIEGSLKKILLIISSEIFKRDIQEDTI